MSAPVRWRAFRPDGSEIIIPPHIEATRDAALTFITAPSFGMSDRSMRALFAEDLSTAGWAFIEAHGWRIEPVQS